MLEQCLDYSICLRLWVFSYENQPQQLTDTVALNLSTNSMTEVDMRMPMSETTKGIIKQYLTYLIPNIASLWCLNVAVFFGSAGNGGEIRVQRWQHPWAASNSPSTYKECLLSHDGEC